MARPKQTPGKHLATQVVHAGEDRSRLGHSLSEPIVQTATYTFENTAALVHFMEQHRDTDGAPREEYGRYGNPTVRVFEEKLAMLEETGDAVAFGSGMAAVTSAILALVKSGAHVILFSDCYRRTRQFVTNFLDRFGVTSTLIPPADLDALERAITPQTRLVVSESPTNPYQTVVDLDLLSAICKPRRIKTMIDATFATPINLKPAEHGIDLVVHSATKYLGGHNDVLGGVVAGQANLISLVRDVRNVLGGILDPHAAYLLLRGIKTLSVRVSKQNETAMAMARALEGHPRIRRVHYPGLPSHPSHEIAKRLMKGFGGVVTFSIGGDLSRTSKFIDALQIPRIGPSLGGVESLVEQPALMSFFELTTEERLAIGMSDDLVRYAVGIEDAEDLIGDVMQALDKI